MTTTTTPTTKTTTTRNPTHAVPASISEVRAAVHGLQIEEAELRSHSIAAQHLKGVVSYKGEPGLQTPLAPLAPEAKGSGGPAQHLNVDAFGKALHAALKDSVVGYEMGMRQNGVPIYNLQWNWSHMPVDGGQGWNGNIQMHIASCSKLITAMAMCRLLDAKGISYDAKISGYLPSYWVKGPKVGLITFRHLMTHRSGFNANNATDFVAMKNEVANGVAAVGNYDYENMNFGLCRILIAIINGNIAKTAAIGDVAWDVVTINAYSSYMTSMVFTPAGSGGTLSHSASCALAYNFPPTLPGWNSGALGTVAGGAGWHLSVTQLLDVMGAFRRKGTIMSVAKAQIVMDSGFGIDVIANTPAGRLYNKNGGWGDGAARTEQSLAYFLPENMELVVYANSPVGVPAKFFRTVVTDLYMAHLV